jgi:hypothetical protein
MIRGRTTGVGLVLFLVAAVIAWWAGMDVGHAVAVGGGAFAVVVLWRAAPGWDAADWRPGARATPPGTRGDILKLGWSLGSNRGRTGVDTVGLRRLRALARTRLERHGLDLDDAAHRDRIVALLGPRAYEVVRPGRSARPRLRDFEACVTVVARLDAGPPRTQTPPQNPNGTGDPHAR